MLDKLLTYAKFGTLFCGVEHTFFDHKEEINVLLLKKKRDEFLLKEKIKCESVHELNGRLQKDQHLYLIISSDKILSKTLEGVFTGKNAIAEAFPNLNSNDFYYEVYNTTQKTFVSIGRKEYITNFLASYKKQHLNVVGFSLGNLIVSQFKDIAQYNHLETSHSRIVFEDNEVESIEPLTKVSNKEYTLNGLHISNFSVLPLAGIIAYYTQRTFTDSNFENESIRLLSHFKQQRIFKVGLTSGLAFIFISLLVSFLFFNSYNSTINSVTAELELNKTYKNSLLELTEEVRKKERLVTDYSLSHSKVSWYLDQLGSSLPTSITLTVLNYQPQLKNIKKGKQVLIDENTIVIKGVSTINEDFSNWMSQLEKSEWIEKATIKDYGTHKKSTTEFELELKLKP